MATLTACKYCMMGSMLNLQPTDKLFELGGGCGLGSAWLASFGAQVTMMDLFDHHLEAAEKLANEVGLKISLRQGNVAELDAYPDESFDVVVVNGAMNYLGSAAAPCAIFRRHYLRMLRPGGVMWWGGLNNPFLDDLYVIGVEGWSKCFQSLADAGMVTYTLFSELEVLGVAESFDQRELSLMLTKQKPTKSVGSSVAEEVDRVTAEVIEIYACGAEKGEPSNTEVLEAELPDVPWRSFLRRSYVAGASYWPCVEERLKQKPEATPMGFPMWTIQGFASVLETQHVMNFLNSRALPPQPNQELWVNDMIVPTGTDAVLDDLEMRLEELGLPASHSDPWHILRYEPGYRAHFKHTDCNVEHGDPENDRYVTVLIWLSDCWNSTSLCSAVRTSETGVDDLADGATVFPHYGLRMRMPRGGLVLYSNLMEGRCSLSSEHFAAALDSMAPVKVVLQKWFYAAPVEPSTPKVPLAVCDRGPRAQCKHFFMPPEGMGAQRVQDALASLQWLMGKSDEGSADQQVQLIISSRELQELRDALEHQVVGSSLGQSPHWYAMLVLSNMEMLAMQFGATEKAPLPRLRAALKRCPSCIEVIKSTLAALLLSAQVRPELVQLEEALALLKRLALMDTPEAARLAPQWATLRQLHRKRSKEATCGCL
ncbi:unnamed protein product [Durusdinium trenchii]